MNTEVQISCSTANVKSFAEERERASVVSSFIGDSNIVDRQGDGRTGDGAHNADEYLPGDGQNNVSEADID